MKATMVFFLSVILICCKESSKPTKAVLAAEDNDNFIATIESQLKRIDSLQKSPDSPETANQHLQQLIDLHKKAIIEYDDSIDIDNLKIVRSPDKNFCLVSWDTRMGGTMIDFATMAIFKTAAGNIISRLFTDTTRLPSNSLMMYTHLYEFYSDGKTIYVAHGYGRGSTILPWQEVRAFVISKDQLADALVFPGQKPNYFIEFDRTKLKDGNIPGIIVSDNGKKITVPEPDEEEGFSGRYINMSFNDSLSVYKIL